MRYNNDPMNPDIKTEGEAVAAESVVTPAVEPAPVETVTPEAVEVQPEAALEAEVAPESTGAAPVAADPAPEEAAA